MELLGVCDVLELANFVADLRGDPRPYCVQVTTHDGEPMELFGGLQLGGVRKLSTIRGAVDTLIVAGGC